MPDFNVVADVSETLRATLDSALGALTPAATAVLSDLQGTIATDPARVTVYLFEIVEDPTSRNRPHRVTTVGDDIEVTRPPMALLLRYMITPWSGSIDTDHTLLGRVLQVLYDGAIIAGPSLAGGLTDTSEALKVTLAPITLEDRARVWYALQKPYRVSVTYEVRVVNLDSTAKRRRHPVASRNTEYGQVR